MRAISALAAVRLSDLDRSGLAELAQAINEGSDEAMLRLLDFCCAQFHQLSNEAKAFGDLHELTRSSAVGAAEVRRVALPAILSRLGGDRQHAAPPQRVPEAARLSYGRPSRELPQMVEAMRHGKSVPRQRLLVTLDRYLQELEADNPGRVPGIVLDDESLLYLLSDGSMRSDLNALISSDYGTKWSAKLRLAVRAALQRAAQDGAHAERATRTYHDVMQEMAAKVQQHDGRGRPKGALSKQHCLRLAELFGRVRDLSPLELDELKRDHSYSTPAKRLRDEYRHAHVNKDGKPLSESQAGRDLRLVLRAFRKPS